MTRSTRHRTARDRRRPADRVRARPRLEGLEDRCLLSANITEFPITTPSAGAYDITAGPDGNLWFTDGGTGSIGMINPTNHAITEFPVPTPHGLPHAITAGPDGNLWFTETLSYYSIGMFNPATRAFSQFRVPTAKKNSNQSAFGITAGPDGNLWFTEESANSIGMFNPATRAFSQWAVPTANATPNGICAGPDGNLWFTENAGKVGRINPTIHAITEFPVPAGGAMGGITAGPDGNLWFADNGNASIGVVTPNQTSSTHLVVTQQPPTSVTAGSGFGLTIQAEDSSGNLVSSFNGTVTVGLASNLGGTTLGGTLTVAASGGVATFSGLTLTKVASGYTLYVSASGPTSTTTNPFNVVSSTTSSALAVVTPTRTPDSLLAPLVLDSPDLWDGLRFKKRPRSI